MTAIRDSDIIAAIRALDEAAEYNRRAKTCPLQHRRGLYRRKDLALLEALRIGADQFYVDSVEQNGPTVLGVTHKFSTRRFHIRPETMPGEVGELLQRLLGDYRRQGERPRMGAVPAGRTR